MQLIIGVRGCWKYVEVQLFDGCLPCVGGREIDEQDIETALWFKVLVLESVCIDCSERVISWTVKSTSDKFTTAPTTSCDPTAATDSLAGDPTISTDSLAGDPTISTDKSTGDPLTLAASISSDDQLLLSASTVTLHSILSSPTLSPVRSSTVAPGNHSLMAPHDGEAGLCTDDLQSLFELSEVLYRVKNTPDSYSPRLSRAATVERRSWIRLLHCYLLPLITLHHEDLASVHLAYINHAKLLESLDQRILDTSEQTMKMKEKLSHLRQQLLPRVQEWAENKQCSHKFLAVVTSDLQLTEDNARAMIHSCQRNLELLISSVSNELAEKFRADMIEGEHLLISSLELRSSLEGLMSTLELGRGPYKENEQCWVLQQTYIQLHTQLAAFRATSADLSRRKVLALSVREALEQTMYSLQQGRSTTGIDIGILGGHSTDVLRESSQNQTTTRANEYHTLKEKLEKLLQQSSSEIAIKHSTFCQMLKHEWLLKDLPLTQHKPKGQRSSDLQTLATLVKLHFEETAEKMCQHFNSYQVEFVQKSWLCYERAFFEHFSSDFMNLYQDHYSKQCEQLMINSLSASLIEPQHLNLHIAQVPLELFPARSFEDVIELYQLLRGEQLGSMAAYSSSQDNSCMDETSEKFQDYFGGVISDIASLSLAFSPLSKLQFLTSAFRKLMASLSRMKLAPLVAQSIEVGSDSVDINSAAVSCDEMLPVLVLVLLQLKPTFLSELYLQCCFLSDYIAPFLSPGWHGYSLASFSSALHVLSKL